MRYRKLIFLFFFSFFLYGCYTSTTQENINELIKISIDEVNDRFSKLHEDYYIESVWNGLVEKKDNLIDDLNNSQVISRVKVLRGNDVKYFDDLLQKEVLFTLSNAFTEGSGTEEDPFIIDNKYKLLNLSKEAYYGKTKDVYYALGSNIDLKGFDFIFVPIGKKDDLDISEGFSGYFDGRGHIIRNLEFTDEINYYKHFESNKDFGTCICSLFACNSGEIKNVGLEKYNVNITVNSYYDVCASGICADNSGVISNCYVIGNEIIKLPLDYKWILEYDTWDMSAQRQLVALYDYADHEYRYELSGIVGTTYGQGTINNCYSWVYITLYIKSSAISSHKMHISIGGICSGYNKNNNCLVIGKIKIMVDDNQSFEHLDLIEPIGRYFYNSYTYDDYDSQYVVNDMDLNDKSYYTDILGWDESIWNLDNIEFKEGIFSSNRWPILKIGGYE